MLWYCLCPGFQLKNNHPPFASIPSHYSARETRCSPCTNWPSSPDRHHRFLTCRKPGVSQDNRMARRGGVGVCFGLFLPFPPLFTVSPFSARMTLFSPSRLNRGPRIPPITLDDFCHPNKVCFEPLRRRSHHHFVSNPSLLPHTENLLRHPFFPRVLDLYLLGPNVFGDNTKNSCSPSLLISSPHHSLTQFSSRCL